MCLENAQNFIYLQDAIDTKDQQKEYYLLRVTVFKRQIINEKMSKYPFIELRNETRQNHLG